MNKPVLKLASLLGAFCAIATVGITASAFGALLENSGAAAAASGAKDKICVVSQNTGLAMWYNATNHGFSAAATGQSEDGFASTEQLIFGFDHQLASSAFEEPSVYSVDLS